MKHLFLQNQKRPKKNKKHICLRNLWDRLEPNEMTSWLMFIPAYRPSKGRELAWRIVYINLGS